MAVYVLNPTADVGWTPGKLSESATVFAGGGNDEIYGSWTDDFLYGQDGDDIIVGSP